MPRAAVLVAVSAALIAGAAGCGSPGEELPRAGMKPILNLKTARKKDPDNGTLEQEAVVKVMETSREEFKARYGAVTADMQPTELGAVFAGYYDVIEKLDTKDCPIEFKAAWNRHLKAWRAFRDALGTVPDNLFEDVEFMEMVQVLFATSNAEKTARLGNDVQKTARQVVTTLNAVQGAAESAGVACQ